MTGGGDAGIIVKAATCVDGERLFECNRCGETYTEVLPAKDNHTFGSWIVTTPPSYGIAGVETRECSVCHTTENRPIDPLLAKDGDIAINLILNKTYDSKAITIANSDIVRKKEGNTLSLSDSEKVIIEFKKHKQIRNEYVKTVNDKILVFLAFAFDLNYDYSKQTILEKGYYDKMFEHIKNKDKFKPYFDEVKKYLKGE